VSAIAGVDLVPAIEYEIDHCNISFNDKKPAQDELERMSGNSDGEAFCMASGQLPLSLRYDALRL
jgi:hypothetical protein